MNSQDQSSDVLSKAIKTAHMHVDSQKTTACSVICRQWCAAAPYIYPASQHVTAYIYLLKPTPAGALVYAPVC